MRIIKRAAILLLTGLLLLPQCLAAGEGRTAEAQDVAGYCRLKVSVNRKQKDLILARSLSKYWDGGTDGTLTVTLPGKKLAQGVMLSFYETVPPVIVESMDGAEPERIARYDLPYHNDYIAFSRPAHSFRIRADEGRKLAINRLNVLTEGTLPDWVQRWEPPLEGADIQLIACHPDDEVLWFGGLLPTYASELGKRVQVTFNHTGTRADRRNELLDALWHCGVRHYPNLPDQKWNPDTPEYMVRMIRKTKASVVVTQDVNGEYGNENHKRMVAAVIEAVTHQCADPQAMPASAELYGVWQPKKLYVHLWPENESIFDWSRKLTTMRGKTGYEIAVSAFRRHMSQQNGRHEVLMSGKYDCRRLGLYFTLVGPDDTEHPDVLQHIE